MLLPHFRGCCVTVDGSGALQRQIPVWRRIGKAGNEPEAGLTDARGPGCAWRACAAPRVRALQPDKCESLPPGKCRWHSIFDLISASQRAITAGAVVHYNRGIDPIVMSQLREARETVRRDPPHTAHRAIGRERGRRTSPSPAAGNFFTNLLNEVVTDLPGWVSARAVQRIGSAVGKPASRV